ncbi:MAG: NAD(+)/NADH kinase [Ruminococcus sp.]|nr:NAD(+)/NADH kinase [Ruminococcus sp.]
MKAVVIPNIQKEKALSCTQNVCKQLYQYQIESIIDSNLKKYFDEKPYISFQPISQATNEAAFAIAIGGDGTILRCAKYVIGKNISLLGINTGTLGFMASIESEQLNELSRLKSGDYRISKRMMICGDLIDSRGNIIYHCTALNDITVNRQFSRVFDFEVYRNDVLLGSYRSDGVIFSTPTGSTAYALSAGGPIIEPEFPCIELSLICPHVYFARPILFSPETRLRVVLKTHHMNDSYICADGEAPIIFKEDYILEVYRSPHELNLIDLSGNTFFDSLSNKLIQPLKRI